jgi:hypothetical protein
MREIKAEIWINAPAERVWNVLNDFASYPEWNPFITTMAGENKLGSTLEVVAVPSGRKALNFKTELANRDENKELLMKSVYIRGLLKGQHAFFVDRIDAQRTLFSQTIVFSGVLRPLLGGTIRDTQKAMVQMNEAIKKRCEAAGTK